MVQELFHKNILKNWNLDVDFQKQNQTKVLVDIYLMSYYHLSFELMYY